MKPLLSWVEVSPDLVRSTCDRFELRRVVGALYTRWEVWGLMRPNPPHWFLLESTNLDAAKEDAESCNGAVVAKAGVES